MKSVPQTGYRCRQGHRVVYTGLVSYWTTSQYLAGAPDSQASSRKTSPDHRKTRRPGDFAKGSTVKDLWGLVLGRPVRARQQSRRSPGWRRNQRPRLPHPPRRCRRRSPPWPMTCSGMSTMLADRRSCNGACGRQTAGDRPADSPSGCDDRGVLGRVCRGSGGGGGGLKNDSRGDPTTP